MASSLNIWLNRNSSALSVREAGMQRLSRATGEDDGDVVNSMPVRRAPKDAGSNDGSSRCDELEYSREQQRGNKR